MAIDTPSPPRVGDTTIPDALTATTFLATTDGGIARASFEDREWGVSHELVTKDVRCLAVDPTTPAILYAGTQGDGVYQSVDGGETWEFLGLDGVVVKSLAVSPHDPAVIYAGAKPAAIYVSRDGGLTWTKPPGFAKIPGRRLWFSPAEPPFVTAYVQAIALSPTDPTLVLAGIEFGAVVRSTDGGETWTGHQQGAIRDCHSLAFHATDGTRMYEGGAGLRGRAGATSTDGGETWIAPTNGLDRSYGWAVTADPEDPTTWYLSASTGPFAAHGEENARAYIYRWQENGPWERLAGGLPQPSFAMPYALCTLPGEPGLVVAGMSDGSVWYSATSGDAWERLPFSLGSIHRSLVLAR
ncbi:WD40/YVTN/BNR-like repeat-containing protein [Haladaptatus sp. CMSO5]|uniref:WD40/YVTN/BNR-like repeat-containing protein n=1 Tax=Haladaptatus sp. CMSO5 TaxID=3120514 RepID=UPI002FCE2CF3